MANKFLDKDGLTKVIKQGKEYIDKKDDEIKKEIDITKNEISNIKSDFSSSNDNVNEKLDDINNNIIKVENKTDSVSNKVDEIKQGLDDGTIGTCNGHPDGNVININNVTQYEFHNVKAGEMIEIPNNDLDLNYVIDCFSDASVNEAAIYRSVDFTNVSCRNVLFYNSEYIKHDKNGISLQNEINKYIAEQLDCDSSYFVINVTENITHQDLNKIESIQEIGVRKNEE